MIKTKFTAPAINKIGIIAKVNTPIIGFCLGISETRLNRKRQSINSTRTTAIFIRASSRIAAQNRKKDLQKGYNNHLSIIKGSINSYKINIKNITKL